MQKEEYNPAMVIGKKYERGLLPFGGCVDSTGRITCALSERDIQGMIQKLKSL
jgi:hypothetical protein